jgi:putative component of membrane protein insertase Oxa1/YidC/SpoIIIJ protein YidD
MKEFTLCSTTAAQAGRHGSCSVHGGDACLKQFVAKGEVYAATRLDACRQLRREGYAVVQREDDDELQAEADDEMAWFDVRPEQRACGMLCPCECHFAERPCSGCVPR